MAVGLFFFGRRRDRGAREEGQLGYRSLEFTCTVRTLKEYASTVLREMLRKLDAISGKSLDPVSLQEWKLP